MSMPPHAPPTPTLDRIQEVHKESQAIGEFLNWLTHERGLTICEWLSNSEYDGTYEYANATVNDLLHEYFNIDPVAEEEERKALLAWIREL